MGPLIGFVVVVVILVLISRYREYPPGHRPSLNPWKWLRGQQFHRAHRPDETARRFAEQWSKHPTLSKRQAKAAKRAMRKRDRG